MNNAPDTSDDGDHDLIGGYKKTTIYWVSHSSLDATSKLISGSA